MNAAIFIILEVAALSMPRHGETMQNIWLSKGCHAFMATIWGGTQNLSQYFRLRQTNEELAQENTMLKAKVARLEAEVRDSMIMGTFPDIARNFRYIPATIAKISNGSEHNYIIINKGSDDGIHKGSGLITWRGAIGIIDAEAGGKGDDHGDGRAHLQWDADYHCRQERYHRVGTELEIVADYALYDDQQKIRQPKILFCFHLSSNSSISSLPVFSTTVTCQTDLRSSNNEIRIS